MFSMPQRQLHDSPLNVLIFDNSPDILELLTTDLKGRGCIVTTGSVSAIRHGEIDGAQLIESTAPDVVVFDIALPYEANWRVATELQADPRVRVPFVLTTTNATAVRRLIGRDLIELVGKPYDLDTLYDVIIRSVCPDIADRTAAPANADPSTLRPLDPSTRSGSSRATPKDDTLRVASDVEGREPQSRPEQSRGPTASTASPAASRDDGDRRSGVDRRTLVRRQTGHPEPEFL